MNIRMFAAAAGLAFSLGMGGMAAAETADVMIPAGPGGGWDTTGRQTMQALADAGIATDGANFTNKGGAAGTIGLAEFISTQEGNDNALIFNGAVMVGGIALNNSPVSLDQTTPIARLTNEYLAVAVSADLPFQTIGDFVEALKADPGAVPVGGGSAGGSDHILLALIAKDQGADVTKLNYIAQTSGAETAAAAIGGSIAAAISGISEFKSFVEFRPHAHPRRLIGGKARQCRRADPHRERHQRGGRELARRVRRTRNVGRGPAGMDRPLRSASRHG